ncbi:MAG: superoxide dismutase [Defluviitaleaceae bacterium]|nr:superoxide dismutase [Defluviitaleaceae bacterium]
MKLEAKNFNYNTKIISEPAFDNHITLYNGYINKLNEIDDVLKQNPEEAKANATYSHFRGLKVAETFALCGVILHELYFENIGNTQTQPSQETINTLAKYFGDFTKWHKDFTACANSARGWVCLIYDQRTESFRNIVLDAHNEGNIPHSYPVLALDMYEHAYFMDYGTDKAGYIATFMEYINWDVVNRRLQNLK